MALLSPVVQAGGIWRVQIVWPNGAKHYVGKFTSEKDAVAWIDAQRGRWTARDSVLLCVSGRGDKDVAQVMEMGILNS